LDALEKSLVAFPQVLPMVGTKPENVQRLGDASLADPGRVMDRAQVLRKEARDAGRRQAQAKRRAEDFDAPRKQQEGQFLELPPRVFHHPGCSTL
jgi:hypothetical protein